MKQGTKAMTGDELALCATIARILARLMQQNGTPVKA